MEDVVASGSVYVPSAGLFVTLNPSQTTLSQYLQAIAGKKTVLEQVRSLPDQTFSQAMAKTHIPIQNNGPMLVALACDNRKYIVDREGTIHFGPHDVPDGDECGLAGVWPNCAAKQPGFLLAPQFGGGKGTLSRCLDGGWLPKPTTSATENGV